MTGSWKRTAAARVRLSRETGTVIKDHGGKLRMALAYPNSYAVGMSSLALQILYRAFNARPDVVCERVFWDEACAAGEEPASLESQTPARAFDVWAFTVSFELDYFNVAAMLRQAGLLEASGQGGGPAAVRRSTDGPLLIAGGPALSMNPEPLAPFFDAIVIGEAEGVLPALTDLLAEGIGEDRERLLDALDRTPGVYVPARLAAAPGGRRIKRLWVAEMADLEPVSCLYTPDTEFPNRHLIEIARGCGRGCRFCLAGYVYRPPREQPLERILAWAREGLARELPLIAHGGRAGAAPPTIGLVSAAVSDHSQIDALADELRAMGARISVSSMRTDPVSRPLVRALAAGGAGTLTIAPEAGSERLRRVINKVQTEDDLLAAAALAQEHNFPHLKMYFMVGHPTETDDDIRGIINLVLKVRGIFRRKVTINATPFVPKAHTPFQWTAMAPARLLAERQRSLVRALARHGVAVDADSPQWAEVQGVLARGDRRVAPVLAAQGAPRVRSFHDALIRQGLDAADYLRERAPGEALPWDLIESGVTQSFLVHEWRLAERAQPGRGCPPDISGCLACGVCRGAPAAEAARP